jgi:ADP-ribosylglycohydrolase
MCEILAQIGDGRSWRTVSAEAYGGEGSQGNGGAMRVAPLGAFFGGDLDKCAEQARLSAEVTHAHLEGQAGAIAVAVAASWLADGKRSHDNLDGKNLLQVAQRYTPPSETKDRIRFALEMNWELSASEAAKSLGNGSTGLTQDTVAYCLWCAARKVDNFEEAIWFTLEGGGDMDTTCAIVGGLVALAVGRSGVPDDWLSALEPLK